MTPSEQCKKAGLKSLVELITLTGEKKENLINWYKNPKHKHRFFIMLEWTVAKKKETQNG